MDSRPAASGRTRVWWSYTLLFLRVLLCIAPDQHSKVPQCLRVLSATSARYSPHHLAWPSHSPQQTGSPGGYYAAEGQTRARGAEMLEQCSHRSQGTQSHQLTGLNRTWGSAYLSARRTFGRPIGRPKVRFNPSPPPCFGRKNGRRYGRTFGRPIGRPKVRPYLRPAGSAGRKSGRTSGRPSWPAESTV